GNLSLKQLKESRDESLITCMINISSCDVDHTTFVNQEGMRDESIGGAKP
ncbi:hypothetical protein L195_g061518, partial [Trifolium pratense]